MANTGTSMAPVRGFIGLNPFSELFKMQRDLGRYFDDRFVGPDAAPLNSWTPAVDILENKENFQIHVELPGLKREDIKVNFEESTLSISGERRFERETKDAGNHRVERSYGQFLRSFTLPPTIDIQAITAEYKDGILNLTLPKKEEAKPKQIQVEVK